MAEELTRKQLQEQLDAANARIAEMEQPDPRLAEAEAELSRLRRSPPAPSATQALTPYKGPVQASEDCHIGGQYRKGPKEGVAGDVFTVDVPALWTDDPYYPVNIQGHTEAHVPIVEVNPLPRVDFRFRAKGKAETELAPLRANQY